MSIHIYPAEQQGVGAFDDGKFVEQRPIGFPGDASSIDRVGPLFYWAWGKADQEAEIGMHPHKAFEILTYVITGKVEHQDTLGSKQLVVNGGAQVMQTGSGVYHAEAFRGNETESFQIWFEPHLSETVKQSPTYNQFDHEQFPISVNQGVSIKTIIGEDAPVQIVTDAKMYDISLEPGASYSYGMSQDRVLSVLVIRGSGTAGGTSDISYKDFVIVKPESDDGIVIQAGSESTMRIVAIEVPAEVDYPLYRK